jgi:FtsZ-binding cell division protein ZapB
LNQTKALKQTKVEQQNWQGTIQALIKRVSFKEVEL